MAPALRAVAATLLAIPALAAGGTSDPAGAVKAMRAFHHTEAARTLARHRLLRQAVRHAQDLDVLHYDLALRIDPAASTIAGAMTMRFRATAALPEVVLRLHDTLAVSAVALDGSRLSGWSRAAGDLTLPLAPPARPGEPHEITVTYAGRPTWEGGVTGGGMLITTHNGVPVATTEAEPYGSYRWWPCVDDVADKATADLHFTVPPGMVAASSGTLIGSSHGSDGWVTYDWSERYPIATYLVSVNVTNYATFSGVYTSLDGSRQMAVDHFVYPEDKTVAMQNFARIPAMIHFFASLLGEYPFLEEKYGQVEVPYPGMEHQTLTAVDQNWVTGRWPYGGGTFELMYAHELAHHWWGDDVTCGTWHDVWLNEGFGTYMEVLWLAHDTAVPAGDLLYNYYDDGQVAGFLGGTVYVSDASQPFADEGAIYYKGAWVLHMLRRVLGEDGLARALSTYRATHRYGNATTADFRAACEAAYGGPLDFFFDQWVFTAFRPVYRVTSWYAGGVVSVAVVQQQTHAIANRTSRQDVYIMPVDVTIHFEDGSTETHAVWNDERSQTFSFPVARTPSRVVFDEAHWLLAVVD